MRLTVFAGVLACPALVMAAGTDSTTPPPTTPTSTTCADGQIWDETTKACVDARDSRLDDDRRLGAVRELAYAGRTESALAVLAAVSDPSLDGVQTYRGFLARQQGDMTGAMRAYQAAVASNPDNILVRSYMGQAFVMLNDPRAAQTQLVEIRMRGGSGTWAEASLEQAIATGRVSRY